jgi:KTSC domain
MLRQVLVSSTIRSAGYDELRRRLEIEFVHGDVYAYREVPRRTYRDLMLASSKGAFFNEHIRDAFDCERLE